MNSELNKDSVTSCDLKSLEDYDFYAQAIAMLEKSQGSSQIEHTSILTTVLLEMLRRKQEAVNAQAAAYAKY